MIKRTIYLILITLIFIKTGVAQNAAQDFKKINTVYAQNNELSMDIEYLYFQDENDKEATEIKKGTFKKAGKKILSQLIGITTLQNEKYMLMIDNENRVVVVSNPKISFDVPMVSVIDSMLKICSSVEFKEVSKTKKSYQLNFKKNRDNYRSITIVYHSNTHFLDKIIISFDEPVLTDVNNKESAKKIPQLVIKYKNIKTSVNLLNSSFSEQKYFAKNGDKITGVGTYKDYKFINNILANGK